MKAIFKDFHLFAGSGGGALGFSWASRRFGDIEGHFRCIGAVDVDRNRCEDFAALVGRPATVMDLFSREDYISFHSKWERVGDEWTRTETREPPPAWREALPSDIQAAAGGESPDVVFLSAPCKGFSGLLSGAKADSPKYRALNNLTLRGIWLTLEAFAADPPRLIVFENVPRIAQRGAELLERIVSLLNHAGYAVHRDAHDCGELGGLAQHRQRFLLVARHIRKVPAFLYRPDLQRVRAISEVVGPMAMPEDDAGGPMHKMPRLNRSTLERLALIPAGRDWRALDAVKHESLKLVKQAGDRRYNNVYRIVRWDEPCPAVTGGAGPSSGGLSVADPRLSEAFGEHGSKLQVDKFDVPARTVTGSRVGSGALVVADPRVDGKWRGGVLGVTPMSRPLGAVCGESWPTNGAFAIEDPRLLGNYGEKSVTLRVRDFDEPAPVVTGASSVWDSGGFAVADPRLANQPRNGVLGVQAWDAPGVTVTGSIDVWAGTAAVADPRPEKPSDLLIVLSQDGTWHRPLTAWELLALQSFPLAINGKPVVFAGSGQTEWREAIGNAVPPASARAVAEVMLDVLLRAAAGAGFMLSTDPIWVNPDDRVGHGLGWQA